MSYLSYRFLTQKEKEFITQVFGVLDEEKDGELEFDEIMGSFKRHFNLDHPKNEWKKVLRQMDSSRDGVIQFSEFLVAASKKQVLFTVENLHEAFQHFDVDNDEKITAHDLAALYGIKYDQFSKTELGKSYTELLKQEMQDQNKFEEERQAQLLKKDNPKKH